MKTIIITIVVSIFTLISNVSQAQTFTTKSKSCGKCKGEVSINSTVGMTCPHCGVRWGSENTHTDYSSNYTSNYTNAYTNSYYNTSIVMTNTKCNVRSYGSKNAEIIDKIGAYTTLTILDIDGDWYRVSYTTYESGYGIYTGKGWVHFSVVN